MMLQRRLSYCFHICFFCFALSISLSSLHYWTLRKDEAQPEAQVKYKSIRVPVLRQIQWTCKMSGFPPSALEGTFQSDISYTQRQQPSTNHTQDASMFPPMTMCELSSFSSFDTKILDPERHVTATTNFRLTPYLSPQKPTTIQVMSYPATMPQSSRLLLLPSAHKFPQITDFASKRRTKCYKPCQWIDLTTTYRIITAAFSELYNHPNCVLLTLISREYFNNAS